MFNLQSFQNTEKVHFDFVEHILRIEDGDFRLSVRSSVNPKRNFLILFYLFPHIQLHSDIRNPLFAFYYRSTNFESICAWCSKPLNEDLKKGLASKKETHSTVQPNCGEHGCLIRKEGDEDGLDYTPSNNEKTPAEAQAKTQGSKADPPGGSPSGKKRKEGD